MQVLLPRLADNIILVCHGLPTIRDVIEQFCGD